MERQKAFRLSLARNPGEPQWTHLARQREVNGKIHKNKIAPEKLLADLLKRQARRIMADITECPPDTIAAHVARLDDLNEIFLHCLNHWLKETAENRFSGVQLIHPATIRDYLACLQITRAHHRCPAFVNSRDDQFARIEDKLDKLAGLFAQSRALNAVLDEAIEMEGI